MAVVLVATAIETFGLEVRNSKIEDGPKVAV